MMHYKKSLFLLLIIMMITPPLCAQDLSTIESPLVSVAYNKPLEFAAKDIIGMYPGIKEELEAALLWPVDFKPTVVLIADQERFGRWQATAPM